MLFGAGIPWILAWWSYRNTVVQGRWLGALLLGAVVMKLGAFGSFPRLSDDAFRYVFEGQVVSEGQSPYARAPLDYTSDAAPFQAEGLRELVNHPEVPAAYPPVTQAYHAFVVRLAARAGATSLEGTLAWLAAFAFGLDLVVLLCLATRLAPGRAGPILAWGYCPWLAFEFAGMAHFDVLGIALLVGGLAASRRPVGAALLALGGGVKFLPFLALPFVVRAARRPLVASLVALVVTLVSTVWVFALAGGVPSDGAGLGEYALRWESWNLGYRWLERGLATLLDRDESWTDPRFVGRVTIGVLFLVVAWSSWRRKQDPISSLRRVFAAFLFLTPTLHPWYLAWGLPFFALRPSVAWSWIFLVAPLAYLPLEGWQTEGVWREPAWLLPMTVLPFIALWAFEAWRGRSAP